MDIRTGRLVPDAAPPASNSPMWTAVYNAAAAELATLRTELARERDCHDQASYEARDAFAKAARFMGERDQALLRATQAEAERDELREYGLQAASELGTLATENQRQAEQIAALQVALGAHHDLLSDEPGDLCRKCGRTWDARLAADAPVTSEGGTGTGTPLSQDLFAAAGMRPVQSQEGAPATEVQ